MNSTGLNKRLDVLDYLRGFALLGIILVNIIPLLSVKNPEPGTVNAAYWGFLYLFVEGRFYTIFTFLFGVGFFIFISRAEAKGKKGTMLFLRRMIVLFLFGLIHIKFHPGEALTIYAVCGFIILPFYRAPKWVNLLFGLAMLLALSLFLAKIFMVVPLMLLGIAAGQYRVFEWISQQWKKVAIFTGSMFVLSMVSLLYQYQLSPMVFEPVSYSHSYEMRQFINFGITIGPIVSAFYVGMMVLLLQLSFVRRVLSPLKSFGRMALTNYILQTVFLLLAGKVFHLFQQLTYIQSLYLCLTILTSQLVFSTIWLRFYRFGPLEWLWRMATYFERLPFRNRKTA
ncbi:DUF418 domain-containing protein [Neobacillus rhizosphaerae]|uniref:DUF418 domain-containing protein n=1 Tax=Neobacillus rhizosphaerae TaxID=2880965 RepID=UPI003D2882A2